MYVYSRPTSVGVQGEIHFFVLRYSMMLPELKQIRLAGESSRQRNLYPLANVVRAHILLVETKRRLDGSPLTHY